MAVILYRQAVILIDGVDFSGDITELAVDYKAEILAATTMGADTRIARGGLKVGTMNGKGLMQPGGGLLDPALYNRVGVDDSVLVVFANGVNAGSVTDMGFAMKGDVTQLSFGSAVGTLLDMTWAATSRGVD